MKSLQYKINLNILAIPSYASTAGEIDAGGGPTLSTTLNQQQHEQLVLTAISYQQQQALDVASYQQLVLANVSHQQQLQQALASQAQQQPGRSKCW